MKSQPILLIIAIAMTATACGKVGDLEPRTGNSLWPDDSANVSDFVHTIGASTPWSHGRIAETFRPPRGRPL